MDSMLYGLRMHETVCVRERKNRRQLHALHTPQDCNCRSTDVVSVVAFAMNDELLVASLWALLIVVPVVVVVAAASASDGWLVCLCGCLCPRTCWSSCRLHCLR